MTIAATMVFLTCPNRTSQEFWSSEPSSDPGLDHCVVVVVDVVVVVVNVNVNVVVDDVAVNVNVVEDGVLLIFYIFLEWITKQQNDGIDGDDNNITLHKQSIIEDK